MDGRVGGTEALARGQSQPTSAVHPVTLEYSEVSNPCHKYEGERALVEELRIDRDESLDPCSSLKLFKTQHSTR